MTARSKKANHPKDNAKGRRKKENKELSDLASQLPLPVSVASQLDKASVIRLATAYLKLRRLFPHGLGKVWGEDSSTAVDMLPELGKFLNKAFHGFVFILGADASILYISEEASAQLGFSQVQLTGKSFWSYVHSSDAKELKTFLCFEMDIPAFNVGSSVLEDVEVPRSFTVRMKCILPKRQAELAVDRYKVIHCRGYLKLKKSTFWDGASNICYEMTGVVAAGHSLSSTPSAEIKLCRQDFMFRTTLNLQFLYIEPKSQAVIGYHPTQLQDKNLYNFIHPYDCEQMKQVHELTLKKSQAVSSYYRFLTQNGGWIWIQSSCIVITNNKTENSQSVLFVNSILSEREYPYCILAVEQVPPQDNIQRNSAKRCRSSLKNRKKMPSIVLENSPFTTHNSLTVNPCQTAKIQGLTDIPSGRSRNLHNPNRIPGLLQQSNLLESLPTLNSPELNVDKYIAFSDSFNAHGLDEYTSLSNLESTINTMDFRRDCEAEFHPCCITSSPELDDSGMPFENLNTETNYVPSVQSVDSESEQVKLYTILKTANSSHLENDNFLNPCLPNTSDKEKPIKKSSQNSQPISPTFTYLSNLPLRSSQDFVHENCSFDSKLRGTDSDRSSFNIVEKNGEFVANVNNPSLVKDNKTNEISALDVPISTSLINMTNYNVYTMNSYEVPEYNLSNSSCHQILNSIKVYDDKHTDRLDITNDNNPIFSKKVLFEEKANSISTVSTNVAISDRDDRFTKSLNLNSKTNSDDRPLILEQPVIKNDETSILYVLNNLKSGSLHQAKTILTETPTVKGDDISTTHINNISSLIATTSPSVETNGCNQELCTSYRLKSDDDFEVSTEISPTLLTANRSENSLSSNSYFSNVTRVPSKDFAHGYTTVSKEYLSLLNDQWSAMHPLPAKNLRSDSGSSVSLGYASESSYLDPSSPFSTYGESSFL